MQLFFCRLGWHTWRVTANFFVGRCTRCGKARNIADLL